MRSTRDEERIDGDDGGGDDGDEVKMLQREAMQVAMK